MRRLPVLGTGNDPGEGDMRLKTLGASRQWWQNHPELGIATGWAVICGALWLIARVSGLA
jgi:hypothetical protein